MDRTKIVEPHGRIRREARPRTSGTTTLPEDLLKEQSMRIQLFYAGGVILWALNLVMDIYLNPHGDRGPYRLVNDGTETQGAYGLVHLRAVFEPRSHRWETAVYLRNAANRPYITATSNSVPTAFTARPGEPRHWGTQFTIRR